MKENRDDMAATVSIVPDLDLVREAWVMGYDYAEIARRFRISETQARNLVHDKCGYAQQYYWTDADFAEWKRLYDVEHKTYREIAVAYGCCVGTVRYHLARVGARLRRRGWNPKKDPVRARKARKRAAG